MNEHLDDILHQHLASLIILPRMVNNHPIQDICVQAVIHLQLPVSLSIRLELEASLLQDQMVRFLAIPLLRLANHSGLKMVNHPLLQETVFNLLHGILLHHQVNYILHLEVEIIIQAEMDFLDQVMVTDK